MRPFGATHPDILLRFATPKLKVVIVFVSGSITDKILEAPYGGMYIFPLGANTPPSLDPGLGTSYEFTESFEGSTTTRTEELFGVI